MVVNQNPKDSLKSTWRRQDRKDWSFWHWIYEILGIYPDALDQTPPVHSKSEKVPYLPAWQLHRYVLFHALIPLAIHQLYVSYTGRNLSTLAAYIFYSFAFKAIGIHEVHVLRRVGMKYGFLDGDAHPRDGIPDVGTGKVIRSLFSTTTFRPMFTVFIAYNKNLAPSSMNWAVAFVEMGLYGIVLDFWYYGYHRIMHEYEPFWRFHRTHHLTKHPNSLLVLYADEVQEFFDIAGIPLMTYVTLRALGFPMGFYEWWLGHIYVMFSELAGHSGIRLYACVPNVFSPLLGLVGGNLSIEDHDIHHRKGWKGSFNYGKNTLLWDQLFGTTGPRVETYKENIDFEHKVDMPLL